MADQQTIKLSVSGLDPKTQERLSKVSKDAKIWPIIRFNRKCGMINYQIEHVIIDDGKRPDRRLSI